MYLELHSHWNTHACTWWDSVYPTICEEWCLTDIGILFYWWRLSKGATLLHSELRTTCINEWKGISLPKRNKCRVLDMLVVPQLVKKFPVFYKTERFINMFTTACHWSVYCQMNPSTTSHLISLRTPNLRLSSKQTFSFSRFNQNCVCVSFLSHMCHMLSISIMNATFCVLCRKTAVLQWSMYNKCQWDIISGLYISHNISSYWKS